MYSLDKGEGFDNYVNELVIRCYKSLYDIKINQLLITTFN